MGEPALREDTMRFRLFAAIGVAALFAISCGGVTDPSNNVADKFSGTLKPGGAIDVYPFNVSNTGEISVIITALSPVSNALMGVYYGLPQSDGSCAPLSNPFPGSLTTVVVSGSIIKGSYCIAIYDYFGTLTVPENYTLTVSHP
jgi:hypothetical protein